MAGSRTAGARSSGFFWPTLLSAASLLVLLALGTWQLERKAWKDDLTARIAQRTRVEPMVLDAAETLIARGENLEYARVRVRGRMFPERSLFYFAPDQRGTGWHVYTPVETPAGVVVIVNRGYVGDAGRRAMAGGVVREPQEVDITGLLRHPPPKGLFTPANEPERNVWYWRDLAGMAQTVGGGRRVMPFFVDAEATTGPTAATEPRGGTTRLELPNRHLEYALTWYGLAVTLALVYLSWAWQRMRAKRRRLLGRRSWGRP